MSTSNSNGQASKAARLCGWRRQWGLDSGLQPKAREGAREEGRRQRATPPRGRVRGDRADETARAQRQADYEKGGGGVSGWASATVVVVIGIMVRV